MKYWMNTRTERHARDDVGEAAPRATRAALLGLVGAILVLRAGEAAAQVHAPATPLEGLPREIPEVEGPPEIPERAITPTTPHRRRSVHLFGGVSVDLLPGAQPGPTPVFSLTTGVDSPWLRVESYFGVGPEGTLSEGGVEASYQPWLTGLRACVWVLERPFVWNGLGVGSCLGVQAAVSGSGRDAINLSPTLGALLRLDVGEVVRLVALTELGFYDAPATIARTTRDARSGARREIVFFEPSPVYVALSLRLEFATPESPARSTPEEAR